MAKVLCSCLCLFDAIGELHAMDERSTMTLSLKVRVDLYVMKAYFNYDLYFVYVVEAFITLNCKDYYKYMSPYSAMLHGVDSTLET